MHFDYLWFGPYRSNQQWVATTGLNFPISAYWYLSLAAGGFSQEFKLVAIEHLNIFSQHEISLAGKLSSADSENFLHRSHSLLGSVFRYGFKTSSGMVPFVEQARMYKLYSSSAGFKAVTSSCNTDLLFPLL